MSTITVYTCLVGDYDFLLPPREKPSGVKFICFTDRTRKLLGGWEQRPLAPDSFGLSPGLTNRYHKFFPHLLFPTVEGSIYIDANIRLYGDPRELYSEMAARGASMACPKHPSNRTLREEAEAVIAQGKASSESVRAALRFYEKEGVCVDKPITENNVIVRNHQDERLADTMNKWWCEVNERVARDQLSLAYVLAQTNLPFQQLSFHARERNPYLQRFGHRKPGIHGVWQYVRLRKNDTLIWRALSRVGSLLKWLRRLTCG